MHSFGGGPAYINTNAKNAIKETIMGATNVTKETVIDKIRELLFDDNDQADLWEIAAVAGGASLVDAMVAWNFWELQQRKRKLQYVVSGVWSQNAFEQAEVFGLGEVVARIEDKAPYIIPDICNDKIKGDFLYYCDNESAIGLEFPKPPEVKQLLISDMTSNIFSKEIEWSKYAMIYASAQKNFGITGLTIFVARKDCIAKDIAGIPNYLKLSYYLDGNPGYSPDPLPLSASLALIDQFIEEGGIEAQMKKAEYRSQLVYNEIDLSNGFYRGLSHISNRSRITIVWTTGDSKLDDKFIKLAAEEGMLMLAGHRTKGGIRASMFNAAPIEAAQRLVNFMRSFKESHSRAKL